MKSIPLYALLLSIGLWASACTGTVHDPQAHHRVHHEIPAPFDPAPPAPMPAPAAAPGTAEPDWEALLTTLRQDALQAQQQDASVADQHYQMAERFFTAGRLTEAELEVEQALRMNPQHLGARALLDDVRAGLGKGVVTPAHVMIQGEINKAVVSRQETLVAIGDAFDGGVRAFNEADFAKATEEFHRIIEYLKWLPYDQALEEYRTKTVEMLEQTRRAAEGAELAAEGRRRERVENLRRKEEFARSQTEREQIELMFTQAQKLFEERRYAEALKMAERILNINPNLQTVQEMRRVTQRLRHHKEMSERLADYVEEWKRTFEEVDLKSVVQAEVFRFPADREVWEKISKRGPKTIKGDVQQGGPSEADQAIVNRLKAMNITLDQTETPLTDFKEQMQSYTNVNFAILLGGADPAETKVTAQLTGVNVEQLLNIALGQAQPEALGWYVQDGVVMIVPRTVMLAQTQLEVYDVQDITYALKDFPGVDIALATTQLGISTQTEEGETREFTSEQLMTLIQDTIDKGKWDEEGKSIQNHQGLLIVKTTPDIHAAIHRLLTDFRSSTGILVNVETRFLCVNDDFLEQIGMDFRDIDRVPVPFSDFPRQPTGILNGDDINPAFNVPLRFLDPDGGGALTNSSTGVVGTNGENVLRPYGGRVQNIMMGDQLLQRFLQTVWGTAGGLSLQYILVDDVSVSAILRMVEKQSRGHILNAPKLTLFNTQRGNMLISNQMSYVRDFNVQIGGAQIVPDPEIGVVNDGISMDVRPIVSPDRRFVTLELRPTVATLTPPPPDIDVIQSIIGGTSPGGPAGIVVNIETPQIEVQRVRTTVVVPDRGTMIVGGLTIFFDIDTESSVPLWREIPVLSFLGKESFVGRQRKQILMIVRAEIVVPDEREAEAY